VAKKTLKDALLAAGSKHPAVISPEEIAQAEFMNVVLLRQTELQEQGRQSKQLRLADEFEKACQQRTATSIRKFQIAEMDSFYLK